MNVSLKCIPDNSVTGYETFRAGSFAFSRCEYFAYIDSPVGEHVMPIDAFLKALMRDIAWGFFYGTVAFDDVFGTTNHYGNVDMFLGTFNEEWVKAERTYSENFRSDELMAVFKAMISDWTNEGFDPFAAPQETGNAWGRKQGNEDALIERKREVAKRMVGIPGDAPLRTDENGYPVNRAFLDVDQEQPVIEAEPGFEDQLYAFNLFGYLSRSDVTWNPSVASVVRQSLFCPTTEEFVLPIAHGNDRVEWFVQLSDHIIWNIEDKHTSAPTATVTMRAGDVAAMPGDIRHKGLSPKRSLLLVWENGSPEIQEMIKNGTVPMVPVTF
ncbi:hypothetical protein GCM10011348_15440 [Marinobacterium nitratireducens]|uniref:Hydroquinone 1,2-dioxygenase large subunit N-terminal domain-containing protein n=1 Tax=Marinobacterium nitratireducens TaxID=518897 RepID=A0A918DRV3_9GAMM|nr:hydroxyquinol 1,2-dioxygenase [Marinobacterium nitratireducens]GGO79920.1 hypothetical protein GCM10011348_15440 [Marinobacterium nitratireducens]